MAANEIYWILKHGIKASGMPAWGSSHGDDELWAMTAFIKQLPGISPADYDRMLVAAEASEIGHHHHSGGHGESEAGATRDSSDEHDHGAGPDDSHAGREDTEYEDSRGDAAGGNKSSHDNSGSHNHGHSNG